MRRFLPLIVLALLALAYGGYRAYDARKPYEWSGTVEARVITVGSRTGGRIKGILTAMRFGFNVPIRGNLLFLFGMAIVYLFALLSMGLFISTRAATQAQAQQMAQFLILPSIFLSGYIFPSAGLPIVLWAIGRVLPATHMVEIMRGVVLRDAGPMELLPNVASLMAMSIVLVWASVRRFQKVTL